MPSTQVVLLPVKSDATISFRIVFPVGSQDDPPGKEGLAALTAALIGGGATQQNPFDRIQDRLFPMAADYDADAALEMTTIYGRIHKDNLDDYYPLLLDAIVRPAFDAKDFARLKSDALTFLGKRLRYASDEELGKAMLYQQVFAGTPYAHPVRGTVAGVTAITLEDVRAFYRAHYTRDTVIIGVAGAATPALVARLTADLGALPPGTPPRPPAPPATRPDGVRVTIVEKDAQSTAISLGFPIEARRGSKEWYALAIANSWLGEHRQSAGRLYQTIRERRGLNYGDYSYIEHLSGAGGVPTAQPGDVRRRQLFEKSIRPVPNAARLFALRAALRELDQLVAHGLGREEFERQRGYLRKYVLQYARTTMARLAWAIDDRLYGLDGSHLDRFRKMMDEVTLDDVNAAVRKQLAHAGMEVVFVTKDAKGLEQALKSDAPSPISYDSPKSAEIVAEDKEIAGHPLRAKAVRTIPVEQAFER